MNQNVAAEGDASLELSTNTVTITPDAVAKSEVITMISDETEFAINITDESWVKAYVDVTNKTLYFGHYLPI